MAREDDWVCLGVIVRPHGVQGLVRVRPFTEDPRAIGDYGPVTDRGRGRNLVIEVVGAAKGTVTARVQGIGDRDQAEALSGTELWVRREALPETEDEEYYHHDLIGLRVEASDGGKIGEVMGMRNHGAGDLLELRLDDGGIVLVPFTGDCVPVVDIGGGRVVVDPPPGLLETGGAGKKAGDGKRRERGEGAQ